MKNPVVHLHEIQKEKLLEILAEHWLKPHLIRDHHIQVYQEQKKVQFNERKEMKERKAARDTSLSSIISKGSKNSKR